MSRPNVVLCLCDQMRACSVGCYGDSAAKTPNIDRLAAEGVRLDLAFTNNPVCTPARSSLLTGQYCRTCTGMLGNVHENPPNPERIRLLEPTLAEVFRDAGYRTALIGKWHIDPRPELVGFDEAVYPMIEHRYYGQTYYERDREPFVVDEFGPAWELGRVDEFLGRSRPDPFFLFYNISPPHGPIGPDNIPRKYLDRYDRDRVPLRPNAWKDGQLSHSERWFKIYTIWDYFWRLWPVELGERESDTLPDGFDLRDLTACYYAAISCVDDCVGQLMALLEAHGLSEDTIVVFVSDHGDNLGSHGLFNKNSLIEEAIRIPLVFHYPSHLGRLENREQVAQIVDVMPTLLDLAGLESPAAVQGRDLVPVLRGQRPTLEDNVAYIETGPMLGLRTPTHLYGLKYDQDERRPMDENVWFYDLQADPYEMDNLTGRAQEETEQRLREMLLAWDASTPWLGG